MRKGRKLSEEHKRKIAEALKKIEKPWLGKYERTEQHRKDASERAKGNKHALGRVYSEELKEKIRMAQPNLGKKIPYKPRPSRQGKPTWNAGKLKLFQHVCATCSKEFSIDQKIRKYCSIQCYRIANRGNGNYRWIEDRTKIVGRHVRQAHDPDVKRWRKSVFFRDNYTCRLRDDSCRGRIEAHHIKTWRECPELRYDKQNGITLCHFHHPRTRAKEKELEALFTSIINTSQ